MKGEDGIDGGGLMLFSCRNYLEFVEGMNNENK